MLTITPKILLEWFIKDFIKICIIGFVFGVVSVFIALSIPNQYTSKAVVASNMTDSKSMGGALSKLGGLASLAGVSLGGGGTLSPEVLYEMITSNSFLASFIREYGLEKEVMAAEGFDASTNKFLYDPKKYDIKNEVWVRDFKFPQTLEPSDIELVEKFKESLSASYARKTKLITIAVKSYSPEFSLSVVNKLIFHFNQYMRNIDIKESELSIHYLEQELASSKFQEVSLALQQIMEEQYKKLSLAKTREEYAFRIIESPLLAAKKSEPKRAIICIVITLGGTVFSILAMWTVRIFRTN